MRWLSVFVTLVAMPFGFACSDRLAGGSTGVETTNGLLAVNVTSSNGAAAGARVVARPSGWKPGQILPLDSSALEQRTDSAGNATFTNLPAGLWTLEARLSGTAVLLRDSARASATPHAMKLVPMGSLVGRTIPNTPVVLVGLSHSTKSDSNGVFRFDSLPAGIVEVRSLADGARAYPQIVSGKPVDAGNLSADPQGGTLLDDFEDGDNRHRFAMAIGRSWWYASSATGVNLAPTGASTDLSKAIATDSVTSNKYLHLSFRNDSATTPWIETGTDLVGADLSGMTALVFRIRGNVGLNVWLRVNNGTSVSGWGASIVPTSSWTEVRIPRESFASSGIPLDSATAKTLLEKVNQLAWQTNQVGWFDLDDIRFEGASPAGIWPASVMP
jgi:hypothetical protein